MVGLTTSLAVRLLEPLLPYVPTLSTLSKRTYPFLYHFAHDWGRKLTANRAPFVCVLISCFCIVTPSRRVQTQTSLPLEQRKYKGVLDAITKIAKTEGWRGFTVGLIPRVLYVTPSAAIIWTCYETYKDLLHRAFKPYIPPDASDPETPAKSSVTT